MAKQLSLKGVMEKPGVYLKRQREMRGISLEDISRVTKIQMKWLAALENDDANLPHPTFVRGFIRLYCKYAGIDSDDAVLHYEEYLSSKSDNLTDDSNQRSEKIPCHTDAVSTDDKTPARGLPLIHNPALLVIFFVFILTASYFGYAYYNKKVNLNTHKEGSTVGIGLTEPSKPPADNPQADTGITTTGETDKIHEAANKADMHQGGVYDVKKLKLEVLTIKPTWMRVEIDDEKPFEVLLRDSENIVWEAKKKFSIVIGNAAGVGLKLNGKPLGKLGENGQVVKLVLPQETGN
ncbi:MAG: DUF4115 domain-containing protein [Deltaproteobacteria bacterium]|nr:DUF4115 domain-containing protein [Deltaproteobacteria bacterium]